MKINQLLHETFETVKIGGIIRDLTNDETRIYRKIKEVGKLFKKDLSEFDQNVTSYMVSKGLIRRRKSIEEPNKGEIYFTTRGRQGRLKEEPLPNIAPPDREMQSWISKNKKKYQEMYGDDYETPLYKKAWNKYNGLKK